MYTSLCIHNPSRTPVHNQMNSLGHQPTNRKDTNTEGLAVKKRNEEREVDRRGKERRLRSKYMCMYETVTMKPIIRCN